MLLSVLRVNVDDSLTKVGRRYGTVSMVDLELDGILYIVNRLTRIPPEIAEKGPPGIVVSGQFGRFHIKVEGDFVTYSNPDNLNQQNIRVEPEKLAEVLGFYQQEAKSPLVTPIMTREEAVYHEHRKERMQFTIMIVVGFFAVLSVIYAGKELIEPGYEPPHYMVIDDRSLLELLREEYSGEYVTESLDGTLIRIQTDGQLLVFTRTLSGDVFSEPEEIHTYSFVRSKGKKALLLNEEQAMVELEERAIVFFGQRLTALRELPEGQVTGLIK